MKETVNRINTRAKQLTCRVLDFVCDTCVIGGMHFYLYLFMSCNRELCVCVCVCVCLGFLERKFQIIAAFFPHS